MHSFEIFFDVHLNKLLNKLTSCQKFEMPWCSYDATQMKLFSSMPEGGYESVWNALVNWTSTRVDILLIFETPPPAMACLVAP